MNARIDGVRLKRLDVLPDERGRLFEVLRNDEPLFQKFGQVYVTTTLPGVVKAWHRHQRQDDSFVCLRGMVRLVVHDDRPESPTRGLTDEFFIGDHNLWLVVVPRRTWHGWKCVSLEEAMVLNVVTEPYNHAAPDEERLPPHGTFGFDWARKDG